jgi:hypothetical protein
MPEPTLMRPASSATREFGHPAALKDAATVEAELEAALALLGLAQITSQGESLRRIYEQTKSSYEHVLDCLSIDVHTLTEEQERALSRIHTWLESTAPWLRVST